MSRIILSLPLPTYLQDKLIRNGYYTESDFDEDASEEHLRELLTPEERNQLELVAKSQIMAKSAWKIRELQQSQSCFLTQVPPLDAILGNRGLPLKEITEIISGPGCGQAEFCMRICLAVQLPVQQGGMGKSAIYVDTTGSFSYCGAMRAISNLQSSLRQQNSFVPRDIGGMLGKISVLRIYTAQELIAMLSTVEQIVSEMSDEELQPGLLVINTISWPFLASFPGEYSRRLVLQTEAAQLLAYIASKHGLAIVLVSQAKSSFGQNSKIVSPLSTDGDVWGRVSANRITLERSVDGGFVLGLAESAMYLSDKTCSVSNSLA